MPLVAERMNKLTEAVADARLPVRRRGVVRAASTSSTTPAATSSRGAYDALAALDDVVDRRDRGRAAEALVEGLGLKPRVAFGPVRIAVTGRKVSPPLFESLELLGRERSRSARLPARGWADVAEPVEYHLIQRLGALGPARLVAADRRRRSLLVVPFLLVVPLARAGRRSRSGSLVAGHATSSDGLDRLARHRPRHAARRWPTSTSRWPAAIPVAMLRHPGRSTGCGRAGWPRSLPRIRWRWLLICFGLAFVALFATAGGLGAAAGAGRRRRDRAASLNDLTHDDPRLRARDRAAHAAAGRGGGVRVPRLPDPGLRRAVPAGRVGRAVLLPARALRARPRRPGRRRSSSTGSRSGSSPASWSSRPAASRPASRCTCSTTAWPSASRSPSAT